MGLAHDNTGATLELSRPFRPQRFVGANTQPVGLG